MVVLSEALIREIERDIQLIVDGYRFGSEVDMKRMALLVVVVVIALAAGPALAQGEEPGEVSSFVEVLNLMASGAGVGLVLAFLFEKPGWFAGIDSNAKWWVVFGCSVGLPLLATVALEFIPPAVLIAIEPYWKALAVGFVGWAGSQAAFKTLIKQHRSFEVIG